MSEEVTTEEPRGLVTWSDYSGSATCPKCEKPGHLQVRQELKAYQPASYSLTGVQAKFSGRIVWGVPVPFLRRLWAGGAALMARRYGRWLGGTSASGSRKLCGATEGKYGKCTLPRGHGDPGPMAWHQEWRGVRLWCEWRGPVPGAVCPICGKDGERH
jgi:hypothetical protein